VIGKKFGYLAVANGTDICFSFGGTEMIFENVRGNGEMLEGLSRNRYTYEDLWKKSVKYKRNIELAKDDMERYPCLSNVNTVLVKRMEVTVRCLEYVLKEIKKDDTVVAIYYV
jgi:hypothetical protein